MIVIFSNRELEQVYRDGQENGKPRYPAGVVKSFVAKVNLLAQATDTRQLYQFRSLNFEAFKGDLAGLHSIRVNRQYRIVFRLTDGEGESEKGLPVRIEIIDIHHLADYH